MAIINPYMIGRIAAHVIFINGPTAALTFTTTETRKIQAQIVESLSILSRLASTNAPVPKIEFSLGLESVTVTVPDGFSRIVGKPTSADYESREAPWRDAALSTLGHAAGTPGLLDLRNAAMGGADHGFTIWMTKYELAHVAYSNASSARIAVAYPWLLATPVANFLDRVIAHEIGHIFKAPDEYDAPCTLLKIDGSGYGQLDFPNLNCETVLKALVPPKTAEACLMNRNTDVICSATRAHWGWIDSDGDGKFDVLP